ncbi:MAG: ferritin-like domain-containing protein [Myxococcales bacterium]|nr:ferritin-like domain-containing protein [Myxococcales bacterium]
MTTGTTSERLRRRIQAALGIALLTPGCVEKDTEDGGGVSTDPQSPGCSQEVQQTVCVPAPGGSGVSGVSGATSTDASGSSSDGGSTSSEGTGQSTSESTGGSTGDSTSSGGLMPRTSGAVDGAGGDQCTGVGIPSVGFCVYEVSEPVEIDGECCFTFQGYQECCEGRPFLVDEQLRTAPVVGREDWCSALQPDIESLDARARAHLAEAWSDDARMEHASIASFSRFVLHLLALGAPPALLAEAQRALADEIEHARVCFALASAYAGHRVGPGPLDVAGAMSGPVTLADAAVAALREGCIGETLAAYQAEVAARGAEDPAVRAALEAIAEDEARHAALAWRFVAWAIERGGAPVRQAVAEALERHGELGPADPRPAPIDAVTWRAHGRLAPREAAEVMARGMHEVVLPCGRALLGSAASSARIGLGPSPGWV